MGVCHALTLDCPYVFLNTYVFLNPTPQVIVDHHARKWVSPVSITSHLEKPSDGNSSLGVEDVVGNGGDIGIELRASAVHSPSAIATTTATTTALGETDAGSLGNGNSRNRKHNHCIHHHGGSVGLLRQLYGTDQEDVRQGLLVSAGDDDCAGVDGTQSRHALQGAQPLSSLAALVPGPSSSAPDSGHSSEYSRLLEARVDNVGFVGHISGGELYHRHPHVAVASSPSLMVPVCKLPLTGDEGPRLMAAGFPVASAALDRQEVVVPVAGASSAHV